jgi:hypothetical protein
VLEAVGLGGRGRASTAPAGRVGASPSQGSKGTEVSKGRSAPQLPRIDFLRVIEKRPLKPSAPARLSHAPTGGKCQAGGREEADALRAAWWRHIAIQPSFSAVAGCGSGPAAGMASQQGSATASILSNPDLSRKVGDFLMQWGRASCGALSCEGATAGVSMGLSRRLTSAH